MSKRKNQSISFSAIQVSQGNFTFYLSALPASTILPLGSALRSTDYRPLSNLDEKGSDGRDFIQAIEASEFAAEVRQIQRVPYGEDDPFQRIIDEARVRDIGAYLREENALMPNPVILATRDTATVEIQCQGQICQLTLEWDEEEPTNIIDGQHRLAALRRLIDEGNDAFLNFTVPFTLLLDLPFYMQAEMFAVINGRQKPVNRSRIYDLLGYMPLSDPLR